LPETPTFHPPAIAKKHDTIKMYTNTHLDKQPQPHRGRTKFAISHLFWRIREKKLFWPLLQGVELDCLPEKLLHAQQNILFSRKELFAFKRQTPWDKKEKDELLYVARSLSNKIKRFLL
jgi:hypothetical protein